MREAKALVKKARRCRVTGNVNGLLVEAGEYGNNACAAQSGEMDELEEALRGFHKTAMKDRIWDRMNVIRMGIEMPRQVKDLVIKISPRF